MKHHQNIYDDESLRKIKESVREGLSEEHLEEYQDYIANVIQELSERNQDLHLIEYRVHSQGRQILDLKYKYRAWHWDNNMPLVK